VSELLGCVAPVAIAVFMDPVVDVKAVLVVDEGDVVDVGTATFELLDVRNWPVLLLIL